MHNNIKTLSPGMCSTTNLQVTKTTAHLVGRFTARQVRKRSVWNRQMLFAPQIKPVALEKKFKPCSLFLLQSGSNNPHYDRRRRRAACVEQIKDEEDTEALEKSSEHDFFFAKLELNLLPKKISLPHNGTKVGAIKVGTKLCHPVLLRAKGFCR